MRVIALLIVLVATRADAAPWVERCRDRLVKLKLAKATITVTPPKGGGRFGEAKVVVADPGGAMTALVHDDTSGRRYRPPKGIESKRYETWHSPWVDSRGGEPPKPPVRVTELEFHHRVAVGVIRGELVIDGVARPAATLFEATLKQTLEACMNDVTDVEGDPSLPWTTTCAKELRAAHAALANADPFFKDLGKCDREPFGAMCGRITGAQPTWNVLTSQTGAPHAIGAWTSDGKNRLSLGTDKHGSYGLIWADPSMASNQFERLAAAMRPALEKCARLVRANVTP